MLAELDAESYLAVPLFSSQDEPLGLLGVMSRRPIEDPGAFLPALQIIASGSQAEIERERQKRKLRESERRYWVLFEESLDARYMSDAEGSMIDINSAGVELFGYGSREELLENFSALEHYVDASVREKQLVTLLRDGHIRDYPLEVRRVDGSIMHVLESAVVERDAKGAIVAIRGSLQDVTEQLRLQHQLLHSQRMEAVGRMAGGVAHDFNNILTNR